MKKERGLGTYVFNTGSRGGEALAVVKRSNKTNRRSLISGNMTGSGQFKLNCMNLYRFEASMLVVQHGILAIEMLSEWSTASPGRPKKHINKENSHFHWQALESLVGQTRFRAPLSL